MSVGDATTRAVLEAARDEGFERAGIVTAARSGHGSFLDWWVDQGFHGDMGYLAREDALRRRKDLRHTLECFASAIIVAQEYGDDAPGPDQRDPSRAAVARYARGRDYHEVLQAKLDRLRSRVEEATGAPVTGRSYVDTGPLLERELAQRAGLGWFGRNTMLIHPRSGSYAFLGVLLTDLVLEPTAPFEEDHCGSCRRCLDACPTGALLGRDENGAPVMDARLCISYLTIELRGPIPVELRPAIGNRVFGCDICQEVCPFNQRFSPATREPLYAPRADLDDLSLVDLADRLLGMSGKQVQRELRGSPLTRPGRKGLLRNLCVALGNLGAASPADASAVRPVLERAARDESPLVREHAEWALGQLHPASPAGA
ncbi:MAG: tRNA epoxyqueuosine(34) reductase QueG [Gemmatimonadota bacterium]|nr:tRNA epoxyqueuosine(34) reductase QueG [Gemmatimonadota bacterium]